MFKKRYLAIAGFAVLLIAATGCGKKNTTEQTPVQVTPTETPQATPTVTIEHCKYGRNDGEECNW